MAKQRLTYALQNRHVKTGGTGAMLNKLTVAGKSIEKQLKKYDIEVPAWLTDESAMKQFAKDLDAVADYDKLRNKLGASGEAQSLVKGKDTGYQLLALLMSLGKQTAKGVAQRPVEVYEEATKP